MGEREVAWLMTSQHALKGMSSSLPLERPMLYVARSTFEPRFRAASVVLTRVVHDSGTVSELEA